MVCGEKKMNFKLTLRIWILIIFLFLSIAFIFGLPPKIFQKGVLITSVQTNSTAFDQGLRQGQIITEIDGNTINSIEDYTMIMKDKYSSEEKIKISIVTNEIEAIIYSNQTNNKDSKY